MKQLHRLLVLIALSFTVTTALLAAPVQLKSGHPIHYTVQPGDTLWDIANKFLSDPLQWPKLFNRNPQISNPEKIYPGQVLELHMVNGHPALYLKSGGTIKLSPQVRTAPLDTAIPAIPLDKIKPFLNGSRVMSRHELQAAPYVLAQQKEHVVVGAGDRIYVDGINPESGYRQYWIFRHDKPYIDPHNQEILGYPAIQVGQAEIIKPGSPTTMLVTASRQEILKGDRLIPQTENVHLQDFQPHFPNRIIHGDIIAVLGGVTQIGQYNVVALDRGRKSGLRVGDLLAIYQLGRTVPDPKRSSKKKTIKLPNERAGEMIVFRVFDRTSFGLVLHAVKPIHILDVVQNPEE